MNRWTASVPRSTFGVGALLLSVTFSTAGCLVLGLNRFYDEQSIVFDERLLGTWLNADDNVTVTIERSDWRSYRIQYVHPIEKGALTGYLFKQGDATYLDVMAVRGQDPGSFVVPGHALLRVAIKPDEVVVRPLSIDWFNRALADDSVPASLRASKSERDQVVLAADRAALQQWLSTRSPDDPAFGLESVFRKK